MVADAFNVYSVNSLPEFVTMMYTCTRVSTVAFCHNSEFFFSETFQLLGLSKDLHVV